MNDVISRQAAIKAIRVFYEEYIVYDNGKSLEEVIKDLPSVQPQKMRGKWTKDNACEFCGFKPWYERNINTLSFCPNCGADMRGGPKK